MTCEPFISVPRDRILAAARAPRATHLRPIAQAVADHGIIFGFVYRGGAKFQLPPAGGGWVVIVGDDRTESMGPAAFHSPSINRLLHDASHTVVHSGAPHPAAYAAAAAAAIMGGRVVLVETQNHHHADWHNRVKKNASSAAYLDVSAREGRA